MPELTQDDLETLATFFGFVDADHDGFVTIEEIRAASAVDVNNDGIVSAEEIAACAAPWLDVFLAEQDLDGDRRVTLAELVEFNRRQP